jgi:hypothetical protein
MHSSSPEFLPERIVRLETRLDRMELDIHTINNNLAELKALANQGRGSLQTFLWIGGLIAGLIGVLSALKIEAFLK